MSGGRSDDLDALCRVLGARRSREGYVLSRDGWNVFIEWTQSSKTENWGVRVRAHEAPLPAVLLRRENALDRLARRLGLEREFATGDAAFDAAVKIESDYDNATLQKVLDWRFRRGALRALDAGCGTISLNAGGFEAIRVLPDAAYFDPASFEELVSGMIEAASALPRFDPEMLAYPGSPRRIAAFAISGALLALGFFLLMAMNRVHHIDADGSFIAFASLGLAAGLLGVPFIALFLRGRSTSLKDIAICAGMLVFAGPCVGGGAGEGINVILDESPPLVRETVVAEKMDETRLKAAPWPEAPKIYGWRVPDEVWNAAEVGMPMRLTTRAGRLGWEWLAGLEVGPPEHRMRVELPDAREVYLHTGFAYAIVGLVTALGFTLAFRIRRRRRSKSVRPPSPSDEYGPVGKIIQGIFGALFFGFLPFGMYFFGKDGKTWPAIALGSILFIVFVPIFIGILVQGIQDLRARKRQDAAAVGKDAQAEAWPFYPLWNLDSARIAAVLDREPTSVVAVIAAYLPFQKAAEAIANSPRIIEIFIDLARLTTPSAARIAEFERMALPFFEPLDHKAHLDPARYPPPALAKETGPDAAIGIFDRFSESSRSHIAAEIERAEPALAEWLLKRAAPFNFVKPRAESAPAAAGGQAVPQAAGGGAFWGAVEAGAAPASDLDQEELNRFLADMRAEDPAETASNDARQAAEPWDFARPRFLSRRVCDELAGRHDSLLRRCEALLREELPSDVSLSRATADSESWELIRKIVPLESSVLRLDDEAGNPVAALTIDPVLGRIAATMFVGGSQLRGDPHFIVLGPIEAQIRRRLFEPIAAVVADAWRAEYGLELKWAGGILSPLDEFRLADPDDRVVLLACGAKIGPADGVINFCLPFQPIRSAISSAASSGSTVNGAAPALVAPPEGMALARAVLARCDPPTDGWVPGTLLPLDRLANGPVTVLIDGAPAATGQAIAIDDEFFGVAIGDKAPKPGRDAGAIEVELGRAFLPSGEAGALKNGKFLALDQPLRTPLALVRAGTDEFVGRGIPRVVNGWFVVEVV